MLKLACPSLGLNLETNAERVKQHLESVVEAEEVTFDDQKLRDTSDIGKIRKIYKLGAVGDVPKGR